MGFCLSVCSLAHVHLTEQAQPPRNPHHAPRSHMRAGFTCRETLKQVFNISRDSRHLPDVGCVQDLCCKLSEAVMISQTEPAGDTVGGTQEALGRMGHIETGAAHSAGVIHRHTGLIMHVSLSPTSIMTGSLDSFL